MEILHYLCWMCFYLYDPNMKNEFNLVCQCFISSCYLFGNDCSPNLQRFSSYQMSSEFDCQWHYIEFLLKAVSKYSDLNCLVNFILDVFCVGFFTFVYPCGNYLLQYRNWNLCSNEVEFRYYNLICFSCWLCWELKKVVFSIIQKNQFLNSLFRL